MESVETVVPDRPSGRLTDAWRTCVGTGRFDLALRSDHQDSLALVQREIGFRYLRGHGMLSDRTGVHRPYEYRGERRVHHSFTYVDQVVDAWLERGVRPFVELSFMPSGLASGDRTVFWWEGNVTPPRDHTEWADLVRATVRHLVDRYGLDEVRHWPVEVWNEPSLAQFWPDADQDAYHRLYEVTAGAVKDVDAALQVGGPALAPGYEDAWLRRFADFVADRGVPVDFVSRHAYASGPAQHVPFGTHQTLEPASRLLEQFADPRRQLAGTALAGVPVHITEFNSSYRPDNQIHDTALNAAYLAPVLAAGGEHADSFAYWTFCDVFEEIGVPAAPFHGGFGLLAHRQIKKPTYHLYAFMARMADLVLARGDDHLVTCDPDGRVTVLAWAPVAADGSQPVDGHRIRLSVPVPVPVPHGPVPHGPVPRGPVPHGPQEQGWAGTVYVQRASVSEEAGNAWVAWGEMGRPLAPRPRQLDALHEAAEPARSHRSLPVVRGRASLDLILSRHEVTLLELTPVTDETPEWWDERRLLGRRDGAGDAGGPEDPGGPGGARDALDIGDVGDAEDAGDAGDPNGTGAPA